MNATYTNLIFTISQLFSQHQVCTPSKKTRCMVYGAWYLKPKTWKKRPANEPLRDPSVTEDSELEQQSNEKVSVISWSQ